MNKEKLIQGLINTSIAGLLIPVAAISFDIGFYNAKKGDYLFLIIAVISTISFFYFAVKGLKKIVNYLLEK